MLVEKVYIFHVKRKKSGEARTKTKQYYKIRNREICAKHKNGVSVNMLATIYSLSEKSIQRIIRTTCEMDDFIQ